MIPRQTANFPPPFCVLVSGHFPRNVKRWIMRVSHYNNTPTNHAWTDTSFWLQRFRLWSGIFMRLLPSSIGGLSLYMKRYTTFRRLTFSPVTGRVFWLSSSDSPHNGRALFVVCKRSQNETLWDALRIFSYPTNE